MIVTTKNMLKQYRSELTSPKVSQETLARLANITVGTERFAEHGKTIKYSTAKAILEALNSERAKRGLAPVTLDDLGLTME